MSALKTRHAAIIERAVAEANQMHERVTVEYAYPHSRGIAWGVNILRGIRRPDGTDEAVS